MEDLDETVFPRLAWWNENRANLVIFQPCLYRMGCKLAAIVRTQENRGWATFQDSGQEGGYILRKNGCCTTRMPTHSRVNSSKMLRVLNWVPLEVISLPKPPATAKTQNAYNHNSPITIARVVFCRFTHVLQIFFILRRHTQSVATHGSGCNIPKPNLQNGTIQTRAETCII